MFGIWSLFNIDKDLHCRNFMHPSERRSNCPQEKILSDQRSIDKILANSVWMSSEPLPCLCRAIQGEFKNKNRSANVHQWWRMVFIWYRSVPQKFHSTFLLCIVSWVSSAEPCIANKWEQDWENWEERKTGEGRKRKRREKKGRWGIWWATTRCGFCH